MKILIVEDEPLFAASLKSLIEADPKHTVVAIADDLASALEAADALQPDLALVDIRLAGGSSGFSVAADLHAKGVACIFSTASAPPFQMPELALGCLSKPYRDEALHAALGEAEAVLEGRRQANEATQEGFVPYEVPSDPDTFPPRAPSQRDNWWTVH
jgi:two-component system, response regulator PdtaR